MSDFTINTKPLFTVEITTDKSVCVMTDKASGATFLVPHDVMYKFIRKIAKNKHTMTIYECARDKEENYND